MMKEKKYYSIGQVSNICKIPIKTLRYYDEIQVLIPNVRKETSNYRYYSKEQLITAFMIRNLRALGFNLKDVKDIIAQNQMGSYISGLESRMQEIESEMEELKRKYRANQFLLDRLVDGNQYLEDKCGQAQSAEGYRIEEIPEISLLTSRSIIKSYHNEEVNLERWIDIHEEAIRNELEVIGPIYVTFHTDMFGQFFAKDCDIEFSIQVEPGDKSNGCIRTFGGFTAATAVYCGNYADIFKTYIALKRWIDESNYEICGNVTEEFLISPVDTRNETEHVTKIIVPVKRMK